MTTAVMEKPAKVAMNGVDVPNLLATIGAVGAQPELAAFTFRADAEWLKGTHSRTRMNGFYGAGMEHQRANDFVAEGDHPAVLCGADDAPAPVEYPLGLDETVRNGYDGIRATFRIAGDAPAEKLQQIVEQSVARSAVFDVLSNGVKVDIAVEA